MRRLLVSSLLALTVLPGGGAAAAPPAEAGWRQTADTPFPRGRGTLDLALGLGGHGAVAGVLGCLAVDGCVDASPLGPMFIFGVLGTVGGAWLGQQTQRPVAQMVTADGHFGLITGAWLAKISATDEPDDWEAEDRRWARRTLLGQLAGLTAGGLLGAWLRPEPGQAALTTSGVLWGAAAAGLLHLGTTDATKVNVSTIWLGAALGGASAWLAWDALRISRAQVLIVDTAALAGLLATPLTWWWYEFRGPLEPDRRDRAALFSGGIAVIGAATLAAALVWRHNTTTDDAAWPQLQITPGPGAGLAFTGRW